MKLVDKMKDENLGLAILYNFTKGYGHVPMSVYDVVLPFFIMMVLEIIYLKGLK